MIKAKQVFFVLLIWKVTVSMVTKLSFCIWPQNIIQFLGCLKNLFSWNLSSTSNVMATWMYDAENVEVKFSRLKDTFILVHCGTQ